MRKKQSDFSRAFAEDGERKTHVGGQALIEGIMMRGRYNWSVAVREPTGAIYLEEHDLASGRDKNSWMYWPVVRGCTALVESLMLGYKALGIAAAHAFAEEDAEPKRDFEAGLEAEQQDGFESEASSTRPEKNEAFSWKYDFGRPDTIIEALGASSGLEIVIEDESDAAYVNEQGSQTAIAGTGLPDNVEKARGGPFEAQGMCDEDYRLYVNPDPNVDYYSLEFGEAPQTQTNTAGKPFARGKASEENHGGLGKGEMGIAMLLGLLLGVGLFIVAPAVITTFLVGEYDDRTLLWNIVDGLFRVAIFVFYIWLIGRMEDIKRTFAYHGAEHKTIHCYEHALPLTPENARSFPRLHVRCGTAFLIMVMIIAILVYTIAPINILISVCGVGDGIAKLVLVIAVRIALMPVIAGLSYEITVKWAGTHPENPLVKVVLWPGMQMQYLTTNEPDDGMLECAIEAMKLVLAREEAEARKKQESVIFYHDDI